jgi:hypothetical protein
MQNDKDREDAERLQRALLETENDSPTWLSDIAAVALILLFVAIGFVLAEFIK